MLSTYCSLLLESLLPLDRLHIFSRKLLIFMKLAFYVDKGPENPNSQNFTVFLAKFLLHILWNFP